MIGALRAAGFPGVEEEGGVIYARLSAGGPEFRAEREGAGWRLSLCWPVRASAAQRDGWMAAHPGAAMDLWQGETRVSVVVADPVGPEALHHWAAVAEAAVVAMVGWRRAQRAPGEGM